MYLRCFVFVFVFVCVWGGVCVFWVLMCFFFKTNKQTNQKKNKKKKTTHTQKKPLRKHINLLLKTTSLMGINTKETYQTVFEWKGWNRKKKLHWKNKEKSVPGKPKLTILLPAFRSSKKNVCVSEHHLPLNDAASFQLCWLFLSFHPLVTLYVFRLQ